MFLEVNHISLKVHDDITALFTSVLVDGALEVIKEPLQKDNSWKSRAYLNASQIITLLEFA